MKFDFRAFAPMPNGKKYLEIIYKGEHPESFLSMIQGNAETLNVEIKVFQFVEGRYIGYFYRMMPVYIWH